MENAGRLVLQGEQVDLEASDARLERYRRGGLTKTDAPAKTVKQSPPLNSEPVCLTCDEVAARLAELDWKQDFDWGATATAERVQRAAECIGWIAARSPFLSPPKAGGVAVGVDDLGSRDPALGFPASGKQRASTRSLGAGFGLRDRM